MNAAVHEATHTLTAATTKYAPGDSIWSSPLLKNTLNSVHTQKRRRCGTGNNLVQEFSPTRRDRIATRFSMAGTTQGFKPVVRV